VHSALGPLTRPVVDRWNAEQVRYDHCAEANCQHWHGVCRPVLSINTRNRPCGTGADWINRNDTARRLTVI
jgi:hypothetical protein